MAVLVAIAIPVFSTQLEKSREATDEANIRSGYAEAMAEYLSNPPAHGETITIKVPQKQTQAGWQYVEGKQSDNSLIMGTEIKSSRSGADGTGKLAVGASLAGNNNEFTITVDEQGGATVTCAAKSAP